MNSEEPSAMEWKTIRISAISYYKLAEISGLLMAVLGKSFPMSTMAEFAIIEYHDEWYQKLKNTLANTRDIERVRKKYKEVKGKRQRLSELI